MTRTNKATLKRVRLNSQGGFTLIELLIAMAIATMVLAAIVGIYSSLTRSYTTESARAGAQQDVRSAMTIMCNDIRHAGLDPLDRFSDAFISGNTNATSIEFIADLNYDGIKDNNEQIRYFLNGRQLVQQLDGGSDAVLVDGVTNLNFDYLRNASDTKDAAVEISMTVEASAGREGMVTRTLTEVVRLRNVL